MLAAYLFGAVATLSAVDVAFWPETPWPLRFLVRLGCALLWPLCLLSMLAVLVLGRVLDGPR